MSPGGHDFVGCGTGRAVSAANERRRPSRTRARAGSTGVPGRAGLSGAGDGIGDQRRSRRGAGEPASIRRLCRFPTVQGRVTAPSSRRGGRAVTLLHPGGGALVTRRAVRCTSRPNRIAVRHVVPPPQPRGGAGPGRVQLAHAGAILLVALGVVPAHHRARRRVPVRRGGATWPWSRDAVPSSPRRSLMARRYAARCPAAGPPPDTAAGWPPQISHG